MIVVAILLLLQLIIVAQEEVAEGAGRLFLKEDTVLNAYISMSSWCLQEMIKMTGPFQAALFLPLRKK